MSSESLLSEHDDEQEQSSVGLLRNNMEARNEHQKTKIFQTFYTLTTSIGVGLVVLLLFWILKFRGGFAWQSDPKVEFNWHPFLMVLSMVFLYSQSILVYRTGRVQPKRRLKVLHAAIHCLAFILSVVGLQAVFDSHNLPEKPIPNLYSLHSWLGLLTVIIFSGQFLLGFISFLYPGLSKSYRATLLPVHTAIGTVCFVFALAAALIGLTEKTLWTLNSDYSELPPEGVLLNVIGLSIAFYGVLVLYLVTEPSFKRVNLPEEDIIMHDNE